MIQISFFVCLTIIAVVAGNDGCYDDLWQNETLITGCCKSINDMDFDPKEITRLTEKCFTNPKEDSCETIKCVFREEGVMTGDKVNATALVAITLKGKNESVWGKVVKDAVKSCMEKMTKKEHPYQYLMDCLDDSMFVNCPKSEWTENDICANLKKSLTTCL